MYRVMLVEDDEVVRYVYSRMKAWDKYGFCIAAQAGNAREALRMIREQDIDVIFTDIRMPGDDGIAMMRRIKEEYPRVAFVIVSAYRDFEYAREGLRLGATDYLLKPLEEKDLSGVLERLRRQLEVKAGAWELIAAALPDKALLCDNFVKRLCLYLEKNIHRSLVIEDVAEAMELNKDYLGKLVKKKTGLSFRALYNRIKIEYAKAMIQRGDDKVYEISAKLGFSSPDYFTQLFKNEVHMTPAAYKKQHMSDF